MLLSFASLVSLILPLVLSAELPAPPAGAGITVSADERGTWSFVGPDKKRFVSMGINNVSAYPYQPRPNTDFYNPVATEFKGDKKAWAASVRKLLSDHGFNTAACWSDSMVPAGGGFYHTPILYLGGTAFHQCLDVFQPDFAARAKQHTEEVMAKYPDRSQVLGVFFDNEMPWWGKSGWDRIPNYTLLERALEEKPEHPVRKAAVEFLQGRYTSAAALGEAYGQPVSEWAKLETPMLRAAQGPAIDKDRLDFTGLVAERYYQVSAEIVRAALPGTLILGTRFAGDVPDPVIVACGKYCDVISFNDYHGDPTAPDDLMARVWVLGKRPMMVTEYAWRAKENNSGNPNSAGAGAVIGTQAERAERYEKYVAACMSSPVMIGMHWFEFADQSPQGRFDGENSNYGVVDIHNRPYTVVLNSMKKANASVEQLRAGTLRPTPTELPKPKAVTFTPGQFPGRPPEMDLIAGAATMAPEIWGSPDSKLSYARDGKAYVMMYSTGMAYGAGINFYGPATSRCPSGPEMATDLDGYSQFVIEMTAPKGVQVNLSLIEAGSGPVGAATYVSPAGDDGEAFISEPFYGEGTRQTYRLPIGRLNKQQFWGNQAGGNVISMSAVRCIGLQIQGSPQTGTVVLHELKVAR